MERTVEIKRACRVNCSSIHNKSLLSFPAIIFWDKTSYTFYLPKKPKKLQGINPEAKELSHINVYKYVLETTCQYYMKYIKFYMVS